MKNKISFEPIPNYPKDLLYVHLVDAYSFDKRYKALENKKWMEYSEFFFENPNIAKKYGFVTTLNGLPIGHITWDPRKLPDYVEIGHNCIITKYKGKGYGKLQLIEALSRIKKLCPKKIIVCTNDDLIPAQKNYESVGFKLIRIVINKENNFINNNLYYEMIIK